MGRLSDRAAIVTGAGSGIGRASARLFAREGASVLAVDREQASLEEVVREIGREGGHAVAFVADTAREPEVEGYVAEALARFGRLDVVFANAGISGGLVPLLDMPVDLWTEILRVNLAGAFLAIKHAAPPMQKAGGGAIVCTASVAGLRANAGNAAYSASKAGVISLVQTAANALAGTGVRVNAVCPGLIETGMTAPLFAAARARGTEGRIGQLNPLGRAGEPDEVARLALFLASGEASYVNGQAIPVDGGLSSALPFAGGQRR